MLFLIAFLFGSLAMATVATHPVVAYLLLLLALWIAERDGSSD